MSDPFESQCHGFEPKYKSKIKEKPSKFKTVIHHTEPLWRCEEQLVFPDHYLGYGWQ